MGQSCSSACHVDQNACEHGKTDSPDHRMYGLMRKSIEATTNPSTSKNNATGQYHLLFRNSTINLHNGDRHDPVPHVPEDNACHPNRSNTEPPWLPEDSPVYCPTRLFIRRQSLKVKDKIGDTNIYAMRFPEDPLEDEVLEQATPTLESSQQEQCPRDMNQVKDKAKQINRLNDDDASKIDGKIAVGAGSVEGIDIYSASAIASKPLQNVVDWVTISEEHNIYIADVGLTALQCDHIVTSCEQVCQGKYAAYTYAKQTLGCREYPELAKTCFHPVHTATRDIIERLENSSEGQKLQLDDREPHIVKYDISRKERQKLDMHTDKSAWTFLIALSNGCGVDYEGGGTYFQCIDATVHIQRGHALIFPGKLRHCGRKIKSGLRFLLVGFLVDRSIPAANQKASSSTDDTPPVLPMVKKDSPDNDDFEDGNSLKSVEV